MVSEERKKNTPNPHDAQFRAEVSGAVHDFNNLLHILSGNVELMIERGSPTSSELELILSGLNDACRIGDAILLSGQDNEGYTPRRLFLRDEADQALRLFHPTPKKKIILTNRIPGDWTVYADQMLLRRVYINLINNSIKSIEKENGDVTLDATQMEGGVLCSIMDNGCGFNESKLQDIFNPEKSPQLGYVHGIGLLTCKGLIERMGGNMTIDSRGDNSGAIVSFTLPTYKKSQEN